MRHQVLLLGAKCRANLFMCGIHNTRTAASRGKEPCRVGLSSVYFPISRDLPLYMLYEEIGEVFKERYRLANLPFRNCNIEPANPIAVIC